MSSLYALRHFSPPLDAMILDGVCECSSSNNCVALICALINVYYSFLKMAISSVVGYNSQQETDFRLENNLYIVLKEEAARVE